MTTRVLIADDESISRILMREALEALGFEVMEAEDGAGAIELTRREHPDAVVLDLEMPGVDGLEACAAIRALPDGEGLPILVSTGHDDIASIESAYRAGATDFIAKPVSWVVFGHRVRYLIRASRALAGQRAAERLALHLGQAVDNSANEIWVLDGTTLAIRRANASARDNLRVDSAALEGRTFTALLCEPGRERFTAACARLAAATGEEQRFAAQMIRADGSRYPVDARVQHFANYDDGELLVIAEDVSARHEHERQLTDLAFYDGLTRLPNRRLFLQDLAAQLQAARERRCQLALMFIDLDDFKRINDTLGHWAGDELLAAVAMRLRNCLRGAARSDTGDTSVARLGGDEFTIMMMAADEDAPRQVARRVIEALGAPFDIQGQRFTVSASIGIALAPRDSDTVEGILRCADTAMYDAKALGKGRHAFHARESKAPTRERLALEADLRLALHDGSVRPWFQPQFDLVRDAFVNAEALVRWHHPQRGMIPPGEFLPIAASLGLVAELDRVMMAASMRAFAPWVADGRTHGRLCVNLSGATLAEPDLVAYVEHTMRASGLAPQHLEVEVTEDALMNGFDHVTRQLHALRQLGVTIAIDDFGTGYSSLHRLRRLPVNVIKIDRSFVQDLDDDDGRTIVSTIVAMASSLGLDVVAEGVETDAQLDFLLARGVTWIQGFRFARPMPAADLGELLLAQRSHAHRPGHDRARGHLI